MDRAIRSTTLLLATLLVAPVLAEEGYSLAVGTVEVDSAQSFAIPVDGEWAAEVMGYTIVLQFPSLPPIDDLDITVEDTITGAIGPEFVVVNIDVIAGEAVLAVLFELLPPFEVTLEVLGFPIPIAEIVGTVPEGTEQQTVPFDLVDGLGDPPASNSFVVDNQTVFPETLTGGALVVRDLIDPPEPNFIRCDVNLDAFVNLGDVVFLLAWTFQGGPEPDCLDAADANDDGHAPDITDGIFILYFLFLDGPQPWPPYPSPGPDYTPDELGCESSPF